MLKEIKNIDWETKDLNEVEDGIYFDMPIEFYHGNKTHESASTIKPIFESLAHYKAEKEKGSRKALFFDFGNAFELAITDKEEFAKKVFVFDETKRPVPEKNYQTKVNQVWKKEQLDKAWKEGKLIVPQEGDESVDTMTSMLDNFMNHKSADIIVKGSNFQTSIFWTDEETGLKLKTRPDFWKPETNDRKYALVTDLKTDKDSTEEKHVKSICNKNYPVQSIIQLKGLAAAGLINKTEDSFNARFFWVICSKTSPFNTEVYEFACEDIADFLIVVDDMLKELAKAKKEDSFLSYNPNENFGIREVRFPFYYRNSMKIYEKLGASPQ